MIVTTALFVLTLAQIIWNIEQSLRWNNGFCRKTKLPWQYVTTVRQDCKVYTDGQGNFCYQD